MVGSMCVLDSDAHFLLVVLFEMSPSAVLPNFVFIEFLYVICIL
jgi:hypothetical protein